ncbi:hypothetical protein KBC89_02390 [Candidatus Woesebacteria bacterium]|nr:hypothetical protein [Candidatus Woesebacteria bacterium]
MNKNERPAPQELTSDQKLLLRAIRDTVDAGKGYFLCLQATAVLFEPDTSVTNQHLRHLLDLEYVRYAVGMYSVDITDKGRKFLKSLEVDKPGLWNRFSGWALVNILLRFYKYKE